MVRALSSHFKPEEEAEEGEEEEEEEEEKEEEGEANGRHLGHSCNFNIVPYTQPKELPAQDRLMVPGGQGWAAQHRSLIPAPMSGITNGFIIVLPTEQYCPGPSTLLAGQPLIEQNYKQGSLHLPPYWLLSLRERLFKE